MLTAVAECMSLSEYSLEVLRTLHFLPELNIIMDNTPILHVDNTATINGTKNALGMRKAKHINIRYHFLKDLVANETIKLANINTENNVADIFTKPLSKILFSKFRNLLGNKKSQTLLMFSETTQQLPV